MRNEILTREHKANLDFLLMSLPFRNSFNYQEESNLNEFVEGFTNSISFFGISELEFRKRDRSRSKTSVDSLKNVYSLNGTRNNTKGLKCLKIASAELKQFQNTLKLDKKYTFKADDFRSELLVFFEDLEIKPVDVDKLLKVLDETLSECSKSPEQTIAYLQKKVEELNKLRSSEDRGAVDNIPWWKIVAIAVFVGLAAWEIWRCIIRNKCGKAEKAAF
ncbi:MAG: hypothetical protein MUF45_18730 [Spirosomaceae bacterium]|nr:hypothetical protein [Spirosomataceae bacterium]